MVKLLFVDVDGVLHPGYGPQVFLERCMLQLKRIVETTECEIVLSSNWRLFEDCQRQVKEAFQTYELPIYIGMTPDYTNLFENQRFVGHRSKEICTWIDQSQLNVTHWCAIDDQDLYYPPDFSCSKRMQNHFVRTAKATGLTPTNADEVIRILSKPSQTSKL